jgi:hypothetical protein
MTGRRGERAVVDPGGASPGAPNQLAETAGRVRAALEEMFARITPIGAAFAAQRRACLTAGTELTPDRLSALREIIWHQLSLLPAADGAGIVAAHGVVSGRERHLEWWQRTAAGDGGPDGAPVSPKLRAKSALLAVIRYARDPAHHWVSLTALFAGNDTQSPAGHTARSASCCYPPKPT